MEKSLPAEAKDAAARIGALDVVRGVAVLGIVIPNIIGLGQPMVAYGWPGGFAQGPGILSDWLWGAQLVLVDGKFRGLFTLLFGAGMVLFFRRAEAQGRGHGLLARRLGFLGLFGFLHWALLWRGDILMTYAFAGLAVLAFVGWEWHRQLVLGLIGYGLGAVAGLASSIPMAATAKGDFPEGSTMAAIHRDLVEGEAVDLADAELETGLALSGDYSATVQHSLDLHLYDLPGNLVLAMFESAPLMLIGMALLGAGLFEGSWPARRQLRWGWAMWAAGTLATLPIAAWAIAGGITYWGSFAALYGWSPLPQLFSTLGLLALLAYWGARSRGKLARRLGDAGRCAFTNYIGTSALALVVFSGWGLGLFGQLQRLELYGLALVFWALMLAWPPLWLARFRHGPLEWLWRCLTYGRVVPLRR